MDLFSNMRRPAGQGQPQAAAKSPDPLEVNSPQTVDDGGPRPSSSRTSVYAVRVRDSFKGEMLNLQAELQLERQKGHVKAKKVTEGELVELMLDTFKTARRNGEARGNAVPIANDVWQGVHAIARKMHCSPAAVLEQLVVQKVAELGLLPRK